LNFDNFFSPPPIVRDITPARCCFYLDCSSASHNFSPRFKNKGISVTIEITDYDFLFSLFFLLNCSHDSTGTDASILVCLHHSFLPVFRLFLQGLVLNSFGNSESVFFRGMDFPRLLFLYFFPSAFFSDGLHGSSSTLKEFPSRDLPAGFSLQTRRFFGSSFPVAFSFQDLFLAWTLFSFFLSFFSSPFPPEIENPPIVLISDPPSVFSLFSKPPVELLVCHSFFAKCFELS